MPILRAGSKGCEAEKKLQLGPTSVLAPILMGHVSMKVELKLTWALSSSLILKP